MIADADVADYEEAAKASDRLNGWLGKRLQVTRAEQAKIDRDQALLGLRQQALTEQDPAKALQALGAMTHAEQEQSHQTAWAEAVGVFHALDANPATKPIVEGLAGRDYGALAGGNGTFAALLYKADLAQGVIDHLPTWEASLRAEIEAATEKRLRPALEREIRARLSGDDPPPDTGSGRAPAGDGLPDTIGELNAYVKALSPDEYRRQESSIDKKFAALVGGARSRGK